MFALRTRLAMLTESSGCSFKGDFALGNILRSLWRLNIFIYNIMQTIKILIERYSKVFRFCPTEIDGITLDSDDDEYLYWLT